MRRSVRPASPQRIWNFRRVTAALLALLAPLAVYLVAAALAAMIQLGQQAADGEDAIEIGIASNGVHTDLILPISAAGIDWPTRLGNWPTAPSGYLSFGWGDREFYLHTPHWSDLTLTTAIGALFGRNGAVLHIQTMVPSPTNDARHRNIRLSPASYRALAESVSQSLTLDANGQPQRITGAGYGFNDVFFEAQGRYSPLTTCNEWTRKMLAAAEGPRPLWSPFDLPLLWSAPQQ